MRDAGLVAVGSDDDYFLVPLTPGSAQRIADLVHASLPTPPIVDGVEHDIRDVLRDPALAELLSDDGPITAGYPETEH